MRFFVSTVISHRSVTCTPKRHTLFGGVRQTISKRSHPPVSEAPAGCPLAPPLSLHIPLRKTKRTEN